MQYPVEVEIIIGCAPWRLRIPCVFRYVFHLQLLVSVSHVFHRWAVVSPVKEEVSETNRSLSDLETLFIDLLCNCPHYFGHFLFMFSMVTDTESFTESCWMPLWTLMVVLSFVVNKL